MERKIEKFLLGWKAEQNRLPLLVKGARQVGKTYSILNFGKTHYKNLIYLNFESNRNLKEIFERDLTPKVLLRDIGILYGETIFEKDTLIFFDEIQACEKALTSLKYFAEEAPGYHIIAAGSLLGIVLNRQNYSFPVGKVRITCMYPMDFEEFLWALGKKEVCGIIRESYELNEPCSLHTHLLDLYKTFLCVGGMPAVIKEFTEKSDFVLVQSIQKNITDSQVADMIKYASSSEAIKIMAVYQSLPSQLVKENKKFQYKMIKSGARSNQYETPMQWLNASGVILQSCKVSSGLPPLIAHMDPSFFKIYMTDSGLLCSRYGISLTMISSGFSGINEIKGALAENYVAAALTFNGYILYYWESNGKAEIDFVIQNTTGDVIPVEVKSSENTRSKSLQQYVSRYRPAYSIRISARNFGFENQIKSVPLYSVFCI